MNEDAAPPPTHSEMAALIRYAMLDVRDGRDPGICAGAITDALVAEGWLMVSDAAGSPEAPTREQLAAVTAKVMLDRMREKFPGAPWSEDIVDMEAHLAAADAVLETFWGGAS